MWKKASGLLAVVVVAGVAVSAAALPGPVVINEVAWAGGAASPNDEWIELYNRSQSAVDLTGWQLVFGDVVIHLGKVEGATAEVRTTTIPAGGFFLLERSDDTTVSDVPADLIYRGSLPNAGTIMHLLDASGAEVDTAAAGADGWPAGAAAGDIPYASMERIDAAAPDTASNWGTNDGVVRNGHDVQGGAINGTPRSKNSTTIAAETMPAVRLLAPGKEGLAVSGVFVIAWAATDPDGPADRLRIDLLLSRDSGATWTALIGNLANGGSYAWDTKALPNGDAYQLKVTATDRDGHIGAATSPLFSVSNPH